MEWVTLLGLAAGTLTTLAFLPQVVKTWRTKSAADLSTSTFGLLCSGVFLWLLYGLLIGDLPIILTNLVTFVLALSVLVLALTYRRRKRRAADESAPAPQSSSESAS